MIKVEVIERFNLGAFDELKNIKRINSDVKGQLFSGDTFECTKEMSEYLLGNNALKKPFVKVIEVIPEKTQIKKVEETDKKEKQPKKTTIKKTTKKEVAKK